MLRLLRQLVESSPTLHTPTVAMIYVLVVLMVLTQLGSGNYSCTGATLAPVQPRGRAAAAMRLPVLARRGSTGGSTRSSTLIAGHG